MKIIIQRILASATVVFLSVGLNYATTLEIVSPEAAVVGYHVLLIIYAIQLLVFLISYALKTEHYYDLTGGIVWSFPSGSVLRQKRRTTRSPNCRQAEPHVEQCGVSGAWHTRSARCDRALAADRLRCARGCMGPKPNVVPFGDDRNHCRPCCV